MQKNIVIIIAVIAIASLGIGYAFGANKPQTIVYNQAPAMASTPGMHMMPDGSMMANNGQTMNMADMMAGMNAQLEGKSGDAFDQAFLSEMIVHHQGAVGMAELALANAKHQEIKDLANAIISAQNKEISSMQSWQKNWYNR